MLIAAFFLLKNARAQTNAIVIEGRVDTSTLNKYKLEYIAVKFHNTENMLNNEETMLECPIGSDGTFQVKYDLADQFCYLSFWVKYTGITGLKKKIFAPLTNLFSGTGIDQMYLFEKGDHCKLNLNRKGILRFTGKGSDKLNCQSDIYNFQSLDESIELRRTDLLLSKKYDDFNLLMDKLLDLEIKAKLNILYSYKEQLSPHIYNLIKADAIAKTEYDFFTAKILSWLMGFHSPGESRTRARKSFWNFYEPYLKKKSIADIDADILLQSAYYTDCLLLKERLIYAIEKDTYSMRGDSFTALYTIIKDKYNGKLRDELLIRAVFKLYPMFPEETKSNLDDLIKVTSNERYKTSLIKFQRKLSGKAFPFQLQDANGKVHKLSDYKGKLIVIDFWFTGCTFCSRLNAYMHSVIDKYKTNKNIVFMTVCTDENKEMWLKSVASGKYTSVETINLYTNGLGTAHPLWSYYGYIGAPQQLIIDKDGMVITSNPPRPFSAKPLERFNGRYQPNEEDTLNHPSTKAFMELLNEHLY